MVRTLSGEPRHAPLAVQLTQLEHARVADAYLIARPRVAAPSRAVESVAALLDE